MSTSSVIFPSAFLQVEDFAKVFFEGSAHGKYRKEAEGTRGTESSRSS